MRRLVAASVLAFLFGYVLGELYNGLWDLEEEVSDLDRRTGNLERWRFRDEPR